MKRKLCRFFIALIPLTFLCACGIEDYPYIFPITNIQQISPFEAVVSVNTDNLSTCFTNYIIFYRIYISAQSVDATITTPQQALAISSALSNDIAFFQSFVNSDTHANTNLENNFRSRGYKDLQTSTVNMNVVLGQTILTAGNELRFSFASGGNPPSMEVSSSGNIYYLWRSNDTGQLGDDNRFFTARSDLLNNPASPGNEDTAYNTGMPAGPRFAYAALYIVGAGRDPNTYSTAVYSKPSFINVFRLPE